MNNAQKIKSPQLIQTPRAVGLEPESQKNSQQYKNIHLSKSVVCSGLNWEGEDGSDSGSGATSKH